MKTLVNLQEVLQRKVRIKIARAKRGPFEVFIPGEMRFDGKPVSQRCASKKEALTYLFVALRVMPEQVIQVRKVSPADTGARTTGQTRNVAQDSDSAGGNSLPAENLPVLGTSAGSRRASVRSGAGARP